MALVCPTNFDAVSLQRQVQATYEAVAANPDGDYHFHRGAQYAAQYLEYDAVELQHLPEIATRRFAGVGNPVQIGDADPALGAIRAGQTVLDHACGAGTDLLLAARRVGPRGHVVGVDMTPGMRAIASRAAVESGMGSWIEIRAGMFEALPVDDASIDVVISNGVVNLAPNKHQVFREMHRVLKPGGHVFLADVVVQRELSLEARSNPELWAACVGGAMVEPELVELARETGFTDGRVVKRFNCFYNTSAEAKVSKDLFVHAVNFHARKA